MDHEDPDEWDRLRKEIDQLAQRHDDQRERHRKYSIATVVMLVLAALAMVAYVIFWR